MDRTKSLTKAFCNIIATCLPRTVPLLAGLVRGFNSQDNHGIIIAGTRPYFNKMQLFFYIITQLLLAFIGFAIGRFGDKYLGCLSVFRWTPHHWVYGLVLIIVGIIFRHSFWGTLSISFGLGLFISDSNDFIHMRFFGKEPPHKWKFWSID